MGCVGLIPRVAKAFIFATKSSACSVIFWKLSSSKIKWSLGATTKQASGSIWFNLNDI